MASMFPMPLPAARAQPSHVLDAMGLSHRRIDSAIRLSFNAQNTEADIDAFLEKLRLGLDTLAGPFLNPIITR